MKHIFKYIVALFCLVCYQKSTAQTAGNINLTFLNRHVDYVNKVWTFDLFAAGDVNYVGPAFNNWAYCTIRMDIAVPAGVTISSASGVANTTYMEATGIGVQIAVPGTPPAGSVEMGISLSRNGQSDLSTTPVRVASITVNFTGGTLTGSEVITPRQNLTTAGSFWTCTGSGTTKLSFVQPTTFTLPIKLESFTAAKAGTAVNLNWLVSSETNAKGYDVERSSGNGAAFTLIGHVAATNSGKYSSIDASPLSGVNYYRLKMTDIDGKFKYSDVRAILFDGTAVLFDIYPNPVVSNKLNLHLQQNTYAGKGQAILTDIAGRSIQSTNINIVKGNNQLPITVKNLNSGTYFITVYDAQGNVITDAKKLVKQ